MTLMQFTNSIVVFLRTNFLFVYEVKKFRVLKFSSRKMLKFLFEYNTNNYEIMAKTSKFNSYLFRSHCEGKAYIRAIELDI